MVYSMKDSSNAICLFGNKCDFGILVRLNWVNE